MFSLTTPEGTVYTIKPTEEGRFEVFKDDEGLATCPSFKEACGVIYVDQYDLHPAPLESNATIEQIAASAAAGLARVQMEMYKKEKQEVETGAYQLTLATLRKRGMVWLSGGHDSFEQAFFLRLYVVEDDYRVTEITDGVAEVIGCTVTHVTPYGRAIELPDDDDDDCSIGWMDVVDVLSEDAFGNAKALKHKWLN